MGLTAVRLFQADTLTGVNPYLYPIKHKQVHFYLNSNFIKNNLHYNSNATLNHIIRICQLKFALEMEKPD